jgi:hypothetical protein
MQTNAHRLGAATRFELPPPALRCSALPVTSQKPRLRINNEGQAAVAVWHGTAGPDWQAGYRRQPRPPSGQLLGNVER